MGDKILIAHVNKYGSILMRESDWRDGEAIRGWALKVNSLFERHR